MRILRIICSTNPEHGGPIEGIRQSSRTLALMGHETEIASLDAPDASWLPQIGLPIAALGTGRDGYGYSMKLVPWLRRHASEFDGIVVHGLWQFSSFGAWLALRDHDMPYCVFPHGMLDPWFRRAHPLKHLKKAIYWPWAEYHVLRDAHAVCFTSDEERLLARESFRPYRCRETVVSYGAAGPEGDAPAQRAAFLNAFPDLRDRRLILFLGRIHPKKGCDLLIRAFSALCGTDPRLRLVMAGPASGEWRTHLDALAQDLAIADRICWTGMLSGELKWGAFQAAEVFALPSHQENFGIAVAEALGCGVPALISDKVNIWREIVLDGAGIVASDDMAGTTRQLKMWFELTASQQQTMRARARRCFVERFDVRRAAESLLQVLSEPAARQGTDKRTGNVA